MHAVLYRYADSSHRARRISRLTSGLLYSTRAHVSGEGRCIDGKQWGHSWQSGLWAGSLGLAAVLVADELPDDVVQACRRVVASEADRLAEIPPASGFVGDSKAEENGWNSNVLTLAAAWLHEDPRAPKWLRAAKAYLVNTYTVQTTASDPLRNWITTTTLHPSFTIENHGFYHPSYQMVAGMSLGDSLLMAELANPAVARELRPYAEHNVLNVWRSLSKTLLDSGDFVYPSGLDWALHGYGQVSYYAWLSAHFRDPLASWAEKELINLIRRRQEVMGDGSYFGDSVPNGFFREAVLVRRIAIASLHHQVALRQAPDPVPPRAAVAHWPDVKVALQRSERGFTALSYGERVMAQVVPSARGHEKQPYVVTPRFHGIFGSPDDNGEIEAKLRRLDSGEWGFSAEIEYVLEDGSETIAAFEARDGLVVILEVPVAGDPGSPVSAFPVGIENHALTGGSRAVASAKGSHVITAMSGVKAAGLGQWVNIDGRLGMIVGPGLDLHYRAADGLNRRGAAEDTLYAVSDEVGSARFVVFLPSADAKETVELSRSLEFTRDDTRVILRLPRQGHEAIVASLVVAADEPVIPHHDR